MWNQNFLDTVLGFTSLPLGDGLSIGPMVLWMENAEVVGIVLDGSFIYKEYVWGNSRNKL